MEFRFIRGMEIYWTSLGKFMIIKDKHLLLLMHTGRNVFICHMSLKLRFYHQGNWEDWNVRPFWEFFSDFEFGWNEMSYVLFAWSKCAFAICSYLLFPSLLFFFPCCCDYLVSWLEYDYLLMVNAYNTHIDGQTDTNSLIFQVKSWVAQLRNWVLKTRLRKVAMPF